MSRDPLGRQSRAGRGRRDMGCCVLAACGGGMREGPEQGVGSGCTSKCSASRQHLILASPPSALPRPGCQAMSPFTTLSASTPAHEPRGPPHCLQGQGPSPRLGVRSRQRSLPDSSPALPFTVTRTDLLLRRGRFSLAASEYTFSFSFSLPAAHLSPSPSPSWLTLLPFI